MTSVLAATPLPGATELFPREEGLIGNLQHYRVTENESLIEIARKYDLGFSEIVAANPGIDPFVPNVGAIITIPTAWIIPSAPPPPSLVINLPEFRLYYFSKSLPGQVLTFPLGIGDEGRDTPIGTYKVIEKIVHPVWYVPKSIRRQQPQLPKVMQPGPDNPMGSHALRLSLRTILIHGTDRPWGIG